MMKPGAVVGTVLGALSLIMSFDAVEAAAAGKKVAYFEFGTDASLYRRDEQVVQCASQGAWLRVPVRRFLGEASGNLLWSLNWLLGSRFRGSRCWLRYHNRIGNGFRNIDGF